MLPTLIESRRPLASGGALRGGALSFLFHTALIAGAIYATVHAADVAQVARLIVDVPLLQERAPEPPKAPILGRVPTEFSTLAIPTTVLPEIPPPARTPFDPTSFSGLGVANATPWGQVKVAAAPAREDSVYSSDAVEELPKRIAGSAPQYPELLRKAGIGGSVMVEFIVDTTGSVEAASARVLSSTNRLFEQPAIDAVASWHFTPGRIGGYAVRARVRVPLNFVR